jgi:hypothetical protein
MDNSDTNVREKAVRKSTEWLADKQFALQQLEEERISRPGDYALRGKVGMDLTSEARRDNYLS